MGFFGGFFATVAFVSNLINAGFHPVPVLFYQYSVILCCLILNILCDVPWVFINFKHENDYV